MEWNEYKGAWVATDGDRIVGIVSRAENMPCEMWGASVFHEPCFISAEAAMKALGDKRPINQMLSLILNVAKGIVTQLETMESSEPTNLDQPAK